MRAPLALAALVALAPAVAASTLIEQAFPYVMPAPTLVPAATVPPFATTMTLRVADASLHRVGGFACASDPGALECNGTHHVRWCGAAVLDRAWADFGHDWLLWAGYPHSDMCGTRPGTAGVFTVEYG